MEREERASYMSSRGAASKKGREGEDGLRWGAANTENMVGGWNVKERGFT